MSPKILLIAASGKSTGFGGDLKAFVPIMEDELRGNHTPEQQELLLSGGLTGCRQASCRQMELSHVRDWLMWLDWKIISATVAAALRKSGMGKCLQKIRTKFLDETVSMK